MCRQALLYLIVGLTACGGPRAAEPPADTSTASPAAPAAAEPESGVRVLDAGAEPRVLLRLRAETGDSRAFEVAMDMTFATVAGDGRVAAHLPTVHVFGRETVKAIAGDELQVRAEVTAIRPQQSSEILGPLTTGARDVRMSVRGAIRTQVPPAWVPQPQGSPLGFPVATLDQPQLPAAPVGVGARWTASFTRSVDGDPMVVNGEWKLVELDGERFVIEGTTTLARPLVFEEGEISSLTTRSRVVGSTRFPGAFRDETEASGAARVSLRDLRGGPVDSVAELRMVITSPPEHQPDALPGAGPEVAARWLACEAETGALRAWNARFERGEGMELWDFLGDPIRQPRLVPASPERSQRLTDASFAIDIRDGAVALLGPVGEPLGKPAPSIDRAMIKRLARKPRSGPGPVRRVLVYGPPDTPASVLAPLLSGAPKRLDVALAVRKSGADVAAQVTEILPRLPVWVRDYVAARGGALLAEPLDRTMPELMSELLRATAFCPGVFAALQSTMRSGGSIDVMIPAVLDAVDACHCEGVDPRAVLGLVIPVAGPMSRYGAVTIARDASLDGTFADLVARAR